MPRVLKVIPKPVEATFTLADLTDAELSSIMDALKFCSGGHYERYYRQQMLGGSRFGQLYNTLSPKVAYPEAGV